MQIIINNRLENQEGYPSDFFVDILILYVVTIKKYYYNYY